MEISDEEEEDPLDFSNDLGLGKAKLKIRAKKRSRLEKKRYATPKVFSGMVDSSAAEKERDKWVVLEARAKGREMDAAELAYINKTFTSAETRKDLMAWQKEVAQLRIAIRDTTAQAAALGSELTEQGTALKRVLFDQFTKAQTRLKVVNELLQTKIFSCLKGKASEKLMKNPEWFNLVADKDDVEEMNALRLLALKCDKLDASGAPRTKIKPGNPQPNGAKGGAAKKALTKKRRKAGQCIKCGEQWDNKAKKCTNPKCSKH